MQVITIIQTVPTHAERIPANSGLRDGKLIKKFQLSRSTPSKKYQQVIPEEQSNQTK
jgi:hypothetical protein